MAIKQPTVLIVGAGASCELDFPASKGLLEEIARALDFKAAGYNVTGGDRKIYKEFLRRQVGDANELLRAAERVRNAAHLGISIDNIIHQMRDDENVTYCAKLAIVQRILEAERNSPLRIVNLNEKPVWPKVRGTWLEGLAQMVVQDRQRYDLDGIFKNITIICFNYDRNIERFLPIALMSQFAISEEEARDISKRITIIHPYGSIGPLEWEGQSNYVEYGSEVCNLTDAANNIRTFTERSKDSQAIDIMREKLCSARRIAFLGFGYIAQNMELLFQGVDGIAREVYGTCAGLSDPDRETVSNQLSILFEPHTRPHKSARLVDKFCAPFIQEHFRTLTS